MNILNQANIKTMSSEEKPMVFPDSRAAIIYMMHYYTSNLPFVVSRPIRHDAIFSVLHPNGTYRAELLASGEVIEFDEDSPSETEVIKESDVAQFYANVQTDVSEFKERRSAEEFIQFMEDIKAVASSKDKSKKNRSKTYFILNTETKLIKIGKSLRPDQRLKDIQGMAGAKLEMLAVIDKNIESELHIHFKKYRRTGEWFDDKDGLIAKLIESINSEGAA